MSAWIGVDLDGTLAYYDEFRGVDNIGEPIPEMLARVKRWLEEGKEVRIFTARASMVGRKDREELARGIWAIKQWCKKHLGQVLEVTCQKDMGMLELWDDRAVQVIMNKGIPLGYSTRGNA